MSRLALIVTAAVAASSPLTATGEQLQSGQYYVKQTWSQEKEYRRPYFVQVPDRAGRKRLPVLVFLHGNGGTAQAAKRGFLRRYPRLSSQYVTVFPDGYRASWNIVSERSKADDRGFIESIVKSLISYDNVATDKITIMGNSNGAALVNQLMIECRLPNIRNYVTGVSPLNLYQHDGKNFKAKGSGNSYRTIAQPMRGKRLLNISGTEDRLVPYRGGPSQVIPAKNGKLAFVDAEQSAFLWARQMGYDGEQLSKPSHTTGNLEVFRYLDGDVIHYKVVGQGHGATRAVSETLLLEFLETDRTNP